MLLERVAGLSAKISEYTLVKSAAHEANQFETRAVQFADAATKLEMANDLITKLRNVGVSVTFAPNDGAVIADRARTLRAAVHANPHVLADPPFNLKYEFTDRLLAIHKAAEMAMLEAWRDYVRGQSDGHSEEILDTLATIPQFKPIVGRMRRCGAEISALASAIPGDPQVSVLRLRTLVAEQRAAWTEITVEGIPVPVIKFLKACAAEGAPLSGLSDEVRSWLAQRNLLSVFRIRI